MRKRTCGVNIRVSDEEKKRIERYAKKCGLTVSEYLRQLARGHKPEGTLPEGFYQVTTYLEQILREYRERNDIRFAKMMNACISMLYEIGICGKEKSHGSD